MSKWISVKDKLPKIGTRIIGFGIVDEDDECCVIDCHYVGNELYKCGDDDYWCCEVTHWMNYPRPPKIKDKSNE